MAEEEQPAEEPVEEQPTEEEPVDEEPVAVEEQPADQATPDEVAEAEISDDEVAEGHDSGEESPADEALEAPTDESAVEVPEALEDEPPTDDAAAPAEVEPDEQEPVLDDTVVDAPAVAEEPPPPWAEQPAEEPESGWRPGGDSFATPAPAYPAAAAAVAPAVDQPADHDGQTGGGWQPDEFQRPQPGIASGTEPAEGGPVVAQLLFSSGEVVAVDRPILVGRSPEVRRFAAHDHPRLVPVPSPHQEISSTHLEVRPGVGADHGTAVVTDLGSTNGTVLVQPGLPPEDLQPGIAVQLVPGAIIDLGDGLTIQVTQP